MIKMDDIQAPPIGTEGTVKGVDDIGSVMVASNLNDKQSEMLSQQQIQLQESEKLQNQIYSLRKEMIEQENSLENARKSLEQFEKEEQEKLNKAKRERTVAWIVAGVLLCFCIGK